jgi:cardiolipin synthase
MAASPFSFPFPFLEALHFAVQIALVARVILRSHREPASRIAWVVVITVLPVVGILAYLLFGEVNIGRRRVARVRAALGRLPAPSAVSRPEADGEAAVPERYRHLFRVGKSISGFTAVGGNRAHLMPDSNATIDAMVADIDAARFHVHLLFYIWLTDRNGCKMVEALKRAAARGVA